jgi:phosphinothricin acetyltransferase
LEEEPLKMTAFSTRVKKITKKYPWLVYVENGQVLGYAYLDVFNPRSAYRYTCDLSIYVDHLSQNKGIGQILLDAIEKEASKAGLRSIISIVTSTNANSLSFHLKNGFKNAGYLENVAFKFSQWLGVYYLKKDLGSSLKQ